MGNHDYQFLHDNDFRNQFVEIKNYKEQNIGDGVRLVLTHYPFYTWNGRYKGNPMFYGHVHNTCYLDMVREVLPEDVDPEDLLYLESCYRKEIRPGAGQVIVTYGREEDAHVVRILDEEDGSLHAEFVLR